LIVVSATGPTHTIRQKNVRQKNDTSRISFSATSPGTHYDARCVDDLHAMLEKAGDWVELGGADEQKPAKEGTVEAWGRSPNNPVKGWYGLKKGFRGRFGVYIPPLMEALGLCELEHNPKNNRIRAK
jgi:hypothetical protein